ncbi:pleiotropic drug resistance protein 1-like [Cucumis melo var. makuwa]|uniref:Pleiotropic drug resistance protein 1-like n=1 Tax=Cucumis melo var. makuwa TaxID=1194695 RepID=A0A5D3C4B7_CUCMM|nr:pleiotropic drug resistance protein 1-like [Cucumis melo var. makuwa]
MLNELNLQKYLELEVFKDIKKWWTWGYWISPIMYAQNAVVVNEFLGKNWGEALGLILMKSRGFFPNAYWTRQTVKSEETERIDNCDKRGNTQKRTRMILPFEQHSIAFEDITYSVDMPKEMRNQGIVEDKSVLLKGISGVFKPGVLTALMGVSGVGKTTLMDVLAGRKTGGYIEGNIKISGYPKKQETFARILEWEGLRTHQLLADDWADVEAWAEAEQLADVESLAEDGRSAEVRPTAGRREIECG